MLGLPKGRIVLVECGVTGHRTEEGDSGSPVVGNDGRLVGMHIAGVGNIAFMIPAYDLFNTAKYSGLGPRDSVLLAGA